MEKYKYLSPFPISNDTGTFQGAYVFEQDDYCFLLNPDNGVPSFFRLNCAGNWNPVRWRKVSFSNSSSGG